MTSGSSEISPAGAALAWTFIQVPFQIPTVYSTISFASEDEPQTMGWRVYNTLTGGVLFTTQMYGVVHAAADPDMGAALVIFLPGAALGVTELYYALKPASEGEPPPAEESEVNERQISFGVAANPGGLSIVGRF